MSSNKRRKLEAPSQPQGLSAFARLRNRHAQSRVEEAFTADAEPVQAVQGLQESKDASTAKKTRKRRGARPVTEHDDSPKANGEQEDLTSGLSSPNEVSRSVNEATSHGSPSVDSDDVKAASRVFPLSSFKPTKSNFQRRSEGKLRLKLSGGERLVILGSYGLRVISGEITIYGALLKTSDKVHWVHAPCCHALPVIRCADDSTIELESHPAAESLRKLGGISPHFRKLWNDEAGEGKARVTFDILLTSADAPKRAVVSDLVAPPEWNREIDRLLASSRSKPISVMVTGPKSSGKSTFGKLLTNQLLTAVAASSRRRRSSGVVILDLDPGQSEHCVAGQIALIHVTEPLLEPSFCHPSSVNGSQLLRSHTLASITPASDPTLYLEAANDLLNHYRNRLGNCPLVINTPGWVQGTGLDLLTALITDLRPTEVIYMSNGPAEVIEALQGSFGYGKLVMLPSQTTQNMTRTPAQLRTMQTMSYFHAAAQDAAKPNLRLQWNPEPLSTLPPWQLSYTGPSPGMLGVMCYDYQAPAELLAEAINGTLLAAVEIEDARAFRNREEDGVDVETKMNVDEQSRSIAETVKSSVMMTPEGIPFISTGSTLDPRYSQALGLVLVRGIDTKNQVLQVLTPIPPKKIEEISRNRGNVVLVSGRFDTPSWAYMEDLYREESLSHKEVESDDDELDVVDEVGNNQTEAKGPLSSDALVITTSVPWIEALRGNEKRGVGSKVWRVRRDLGRTAGA